MDFIRAGIGITKTMRNVSRLREIASVFAKHGFDEFITIGISSKIPNFVIAKSKRSIKEELENKSEKDWNQVLGFRLRSCFEELGPSFIKFGQLLSSREDLFHASFIHEMQKLRDQVKPIPLSELTTYIEGHLGKKIDEVFASIDPNPIGVASIGVVYSAKLKDGSPVVLKVRRPGIEKEIETDFSILLFIAHQLEKVSEELKYLGLSRIIHDFSSTLVKELNFNVEAMNAERLKKNLSIHDVENHYYIPSIYKEYTSEALLVMERLEGIPFSDKKKIEPYMFEIKDRLNYGVNLFLKTFLQDGFYHADLHGGNFFYLENKKIGLIDFGLMGSLSKTSRQHFTAIIYSLISHNYENLVYEFLDVAEYESIPDVEALTRDVREALSPYVGLTVQQLNLSELFLVILATLKRHQIYLPREWYLVFRALITLDGVGKSLNIDLNIFGILESEILDIVQKSFSKEDLIEEALWSSRDMSSTLKIFPRHFRWFMRDFAKKGYAIEVIQKGYKKEIASVGNSISFLGHAIISATFILSGILFLNGRELLTYNDIPTLTWVMWSLGLLIFALGKRKID